MPPDANPYLVSLYVLIAAGIGVVFTLSVQAECNKMLRGWGMKEKPWHEPPVLYFLAICASAAAAGIYSAFHLAT